MEQKLKIKLTRNKLLNGAMNFQIFNPEINEYGDVNALSDENKLLRYTAKTEDLENYIEAMLYDMKSVYRRFGSIFLEFDSDEKDCELLRSTLKKIDEAGSFFEFSASASFEPAKLGANINALIEKFNLELEALMKKESVASYCIIKHGSTLLKTIKCPDYSGDDANYQTLLDYIATFEKIRSRISKTISEVNDTGDNISNLIDGHNSAIKENREKNLELVNNKISVWFEEILRDTPTEINNFIFNNISFKSIIGTDEADLNGKITEQLDYIYILILNAYIKLKVESCFSSVYGIYYSGLKEQAILMGSNVASDPDWLNSVKESYVNFVSEAYQTYMTDCYTKAWANKNRKINNVFSFDKAGFIYFDMKKFIKNSRLSFGDFLEFQETLKKKISVDFIDKYSEEVSKMQDVEIDSLLKKRETIRNVRKNIKEFREFLNSIISDLNTVKGKITEGGTEND